jgi:glutamate synthase (NADPH/NADH) small chain
MHGHLVDVFEARPKPGGLNEYGIATYKTTGNFAQAEVDYILSIGGIEIHNGKALGRDVTLPDLAARYDAVFLAMGLAGVNALGAADAKADGSDDAVDWIADLRQAPDPAMVAVGRRVVVIGGGMTAIDAAVQSRALGADEVTVCYRGPREKMKASAYEQEVAKSRGVSLRYDMNPVKIHAEGGKVTAVEFSRHGERVVIACDQVFKAIGQAFVSHVAPAIELSGGRIMVDGEGRTSHPGIWAGGDCVNAGEDLTVTAVAQGRDAAMSIHRALTAA